MHRIHFAGALAALALIPVAAQAQTITACYVPKTGSVYRIQAAGAPDACKTNHIQFSWENGGSGTGGTSGVTFTRRQTVAVDIAPGEWGEGAAACEPGEKVTGGGYSANPGDQIQTLNVTENFPHFSGSPQIEYWSVLLKHLGAEPITFVVYAICAAYAP